MSYHCPNCGASVSDNRTYIPFFDLGVCAECFHIKKKDHMFNNQDKIEPIQLGGIYETKDHRKAQCVYLYDNCGQAVFIFPDLLGADPITSDYIGKNYCGEKIIIGKWKEKPIVDWSLYAKWHKWVAKDTHNKWQAFMEKPTLRNGFWEINGVDRIANNVPKEYEPNFYGNWKDSLAERPT